MCWHVRGWGREADTWTILVLLASIPCFQPYKLYWKSRDILRWPHPSWSAPDSLHWEERCTNARDGCLSESTCFITSGLCKPTKTYYISMNPSACFYSFLQNSQINQSVSKLTWCIIIVPQQVWKPKLFPLTAHLSENLAGFTLTHRLDHPVAPSLLSPLLLRLHHLNQHSHHKCMWDSFFICPSRLKSQNEWACLWAQLSVRSLSASQDFSLNFIDQCHNICASCENKSRWPLSSSYMQCISCFVLPYLVLEARDALLGSLA